MKKILLTTVIASLVACGGSGGSGGSGGGQPAPTPTQNEAPTLTSIAIGNVSAPDSAAAYKGNQLKVSYSYLDAENDKEATIEYHWQRLGSDGNFQNIEGATDAQYTLTASDIGQKIRVGLLPIASTGTLRGIDVFSSVLDISTDTAPKALNVAIATADIKMVVGSKVTGEYSYSDESRGSEGNSQLRWFILDSDNNETELGTEKELTVPKQALGKVLYFSVTPIATSGVLIGEQVVVSRDVHIEKTFFTTSESVLVDPLDDIYEDKLHLFFTDGTVEGTIQLNSFDGASITKPLAVGDRWIFTLKPITGRVQLWLSDGTVVGTARHPSDTDASPLLPSDLTVTNGTAYFAGHDVDHGFELWRYDEATGGVLRLTDLSPPGINRGNSLPTGMTYMADDNAIYFSAIGLDSDNNPVGRELFSIPAGSNVAANSAHLVKDINPGSGSSNPIGLTVFKDNLYFQAWDGAAGNAGGNELWISDGGASGTKMLKDLTSDAHSYPANFTIVGDDLYFTTNTAGDSSKGDLWRTRGTADSTNEVARKFQNAASQLLAVDEALIFSGEQSTENIAFIVTAQEDISDIDVTTRSHAKNPVDMVRLKDEIIFQTTGGEGADKELYRINLLNGNFYGVIERIADINTSGSSTPSGMTIINGLVLFSANDGENYGNELYFYDGQDVTLLKDIIPGTRSSNPELRLKGYFPIIE